MLFNHLTFLTRIGTVLALGISVNSEMNHTEASHNYPAGASPAVILLEDEEVLAMRHSLHELGNVLTGVMIAGGLLAQYLEGGSLEQYAKDICQGSDRGCSLVREMRSRLLAACDKPAASSPGEMR